jgi:hypothetical protein
MIFVSKTEQCPGCHARIFAVNQRSDGVSKALQQERRRHLTVKAERHVHGYFALAGRGCRFSYCAKAVRCEMANQCSFARSGRSCEDETIDAQFSSLIAT